MPCYRPIDAWQSPHTGRLHFKISVAAITQGWRELQVPCGQCIGCRLNRSAQWAVRMENEASLHEKNCFLSLTYDDDHLPEDWSLKKKDFQDFMKRFRRKFEPEGFKFYHCGEYGPENQRPHYHACFFNFDFEDKKLWKEYSVPGCDQPIRLYTSEALSERWEKGFCTIGDVTWESAAYCARYVVDKITGEKAEAHYNGRTEEYSTMSKGIGRRWYEQFSGDLWPHDYAVSRGHRVKVPRYYEKLLEEENPKLLEQLKAVREKNALAAADNNTPERLKVREEIQLRRLDMLKRVLP